jgi:hypothetical protein
MPLFGGETPETLIVALPTALGSAQAMRFVRL